MKSYICALIIECVVKIRFIHMFEVKLGRELIWLSLSVIPATSKCKLKLNDWLLYCTVSWTIILQSWLLLKFNQWKEWGNRILISRPCSKVIFFSLSFFPLPLTRFQTDKSLWSSKYDVLISWCIFNFFFFRGGRWTGSWADWIHSIYVFTRSNLFWGCLPYWLGKGIPIPSLIVLTHANWNKPYVIKPTLPTSWLFSKNA